MQITELEYFTRINPLTNIPYPIDDRQKIFISHKKTDSMVHDLCKKLKDSILDSVDCAVWYDAQLTPGLNYDEEIRYAIKKSNVVVLLVTDNILESEYIWEKEIPYALEFDHPIIPVRITHNIEILKKIDSTIGHIQAIDWNWMETNHSEFMECFSSTIKKYILPVTLYERIRKCFSKGRQFLSKSRLTMEDRLLIGIGYLEGIGVTQNISMAEKTLVKAFDFTDSDYELEDLKRVARVHLIEYYRTVAIHAYINNNKVELLELQKKAMGIDYDLLYNMGYSLLSVLDSPLKDVVQEMIQASNVRVGFELLKIRLLYLLRVNSFTEEEMIKKIDLLISFSAHIPCIITRIKDQRVVDSLSDKVFNYYIQCNKILLSDEEANQKKDKILKVRNANIQEMFSLFKFDNDKIEALQTPLFEGCSSEEFVLQCVSILVYSIMLMAMGTNKYYFFRLLGVLFINGDLVNKDEHTGNALLDYAALLNPETRTSVEEEKVANNKKTVALYPRPYNGTNPLHLLKKMGSITVSNNEFYFVHDVSEQGKGPMYLMRDTEILEEYSCWCGTGGDFTSFSLEYDKENDCLLIYQYEMTHYDRNTTRYVIHIWDYAEDELKYSEESLSDLEGRHSLSIDSRHRAYIES